MAVAPGRTPSRATDQPSSAAITITEITPPAKTGQSEATSCKTGSVSERAIISPTTACAAR